MQVSTLLDSSLPPAVRQESGVGEPPQAANSPEWLPATISFLTATITAKGRQLIIGCINILILHNITSRFLLRFCKGNIKQRLLSCFTIQDGNYVGLLALAPPPAAG